MRGNKPRLKSVPRTCFRDINNSCTQQLCHYTKEKEINQEKTIETNDSPF